LGDSEGGLLLVQLDVQLPEVVEYFFQVSNVATALSRVYDDVIDMDLHVVPYLPFEGELHTLVVAPRVPQSEQQFLCSRNN
jgi:hypothetical protein